MSNEVWVKVKDPDWSTDTVHSLADNAQVKDLRRAFVEQQKLNISPATVKVFETENSGVELSSTTGLKDMNYFAPPVGSAGAAGPGKSDATPLFLTLPQQTQQSVYSALERVEKKLDDMATVDRPMSEATVNFASSLLEDMKINVYVHKVNEDTGGGELQQYHWGEKESESEGQPGCQQILQGEMFPLSVDDDELGMYDVRGRALPELNAGKRKSNGFSDIAVGPSEAMNFAVARARDLVLSYAVALVELKTGKADLKPGQLLLQLVSLSLISGKGQGVVVMGTDCATKWHLLLFSGHNRIVVRPYSHGKKCVADFKALIVESTTRMKQNAAPEKLASIVEGGDQDVDMTEFGFQVTDRDEAIERENKLRKLAGALGSLFGENLDVPSWARASETCPSYYM